MDRPGYPNQLPGHGTGLLAVVAHDPRQSVPTSGSAISGREKDPHAALSGATNGRDQSEGTGLSPEF